MGALSGKVTLVTGANRGIGKAIARGLAREGAHVMMSARGAAQLGEAAAEIRALGGEGTIVDHPCDVTDETAVAALFKATVDQFGRLDVLVNNAGAFDGGPLDQCTTENWLKVINVNLTGPFFCTREAMRIMKPQGVGRIINVASISALRVRPNSAPYSASKHGLWGLTQVTALEGRDFGISACCLNPGNTETERVRRGEATNATEPLMSVDELAQVAVLMASLPPHLTVLEATVLPIEQKFIGRG